MVVLKVSANSKPASVAGAIANSIREYSNVEVHAIGAGAVNQAVKAVAIARGYLSADECEVSTFPSFVELEVNGIARTAIKLLVKAI